MKKKEPIRIAQIIGKWLGGGVEAVVMNYYRNIDRSKIQFDFICDDDSTNIPYDEIEKLGGKVILIPPYQKVFKYHRELKRVLKEGNYKIVHSHINTLSVFSLWAAKSAGIPVRIAHSHSTIVNNKKEFKRNIMKNILKHFSKLFATDYFACGDMAAISQFGKKTFDNGKVTIINNAIDLDKFKYDDKIRNEVRKELNINDNQIVIGHLGRFVETKNHSFILDIFNEIHKLNKNTILVLAGQGPLLNKTIEKVNSLGLKNSVKFLNHRNDANRLYQAFDIFILPSLYEGVPMTGIEAQASGLLCFLSDNMTKSVKILNSTKFLSIDLPACEWSKIIMEDYENYVRIDNEKIMTNSGFEIKKETARLEQYYRDKQSKKILHVVNSNSFSGLESVACDIITSNLSDKYNFIYVTQDGPIIDTLKEKNINYEIIDKISRKEIKKVIEKYNPCIIHAHDFTASVICSFVKKKIPLIEHLHNNSPWIKKTCINSFAFLYAGIRADKILTVSESIEKEYIFSKFIKNKIECIDNPISRKKILSKVSKEDYEKKYDICCVARITHPKNPFKFLDILYEIKKTNNNIKVVWVGDGELKEDVLKKVDELKLNKNIDFVGFKKNPYKYMAQSKIFMLTSDWEGYGLVAFEALTLGLPCVVSNVGGLPNIVDDNCGKLCANNDDFINEVNQLIKNNKVYDQKRNNSIIKSKKIENMDIYMDKIENIYERYI